MRAHPVPLIASVVSVGWLTAQALDLPVLAAALVVASIMGSCALADRRGIRLPASLAVLAAGLAAAVGALLRAPLSGAAPLALMLAVLAVAGSLMPLLYAATFEDGDDLP